MLDEMRSTEIRFGVHWDSHRVWVTDDHFGFDAWLKVTGDFATLAARVVYAQAIADVLNAAEKKIPIENGEGLPGWPSSQERDSPDV